MWYIICFAVFGFLLTISLDENDHMAGQYFCISTRWSHGRSIFLYIDHVSNNITNILCMFGLWLNLWTIKRYIDHQCYIDHRPKGLGQYSILVNISLLVHKFNHRPSHQRIFAINCTDWQISFIGFPTTFSKFWDKKTMTLRANKEDNDAI